MHRKIILNFIISFLTICLISGCAKKPTDKVIATINGEPIYVKDLNREIALNLRRDPYFKITPQTLENQVNILLNRRLLIQEAKKKNLDQTDRFVNTIKIFWEQTLIRELMEYKDKELERSASAEKKEKTKLLDEWLNGLREKANIKINSDVLKGIEHTYSQK